MTDVDPEILYAAALGATLGRMRAELSEEAIKRIMLFMLDRYGIVHGSLYVSPTPKARIIEKPTVRDVFPDKPEPSEPATVEATNRPICPIPGCGYHTITDKGLGMHMFRKHGTTLKEYRRTLELDREGRS